MVAVTRIGMRLRSYVLVHGVLRYFEIDPDQYLNEHVKQYQSWYDRKAVTGEG
jgi:hypothetical protein